jgi:hypothetical protein
MLMKEPTYPTNLGITRPKTHSWQYLTFLEHERRSYVMATSSELNESVHRPSRCKNWELLVLELIIHPLEEVVAFPIAGIHRGTCDRIGN